MAYGRGRRSSSAQVRIGPRPDAPNYRDWWERELRREQEYLQQAKTEHDVRLVNLAERRIREAKKMIQAAEVAQ